jgi:hypothetical protein
MKNLFLLIPIFLLISCGSNSKTKSEVQQSPSKVRVLAVYTLPDSSKVLTIMLREIKKSVKFDSAKGRDIIVVDTLWGYPVDVPLRDSLGKVILDSTGKPRVSPFPEYFRISNDSVNWRIEGVSFDSLLKRDR